MNIDNNHRYLIAPQHQSIENCINNKMTTNMDIDRIRQKSQRNKSVLFQILTIIVYLDIIIVELMILASNH